MGTNWVTGSYTNGQQRPSRYEPTDEHWLELQCRLGRCVAQLNKKMALGADQKGFRGHSTRCYRR